MAKLISLSAAAALTGKSKSVISKALKSGVLSGAKNAKGQYEIDRSELNRVYELATQKNESQNVRTENRTLKNGPKEPLKHVQNRTLQSDVDAAVELATLRARLDVLEGQGGLIETLRDLADRAEERTERADDRANRAEERERGLLTDKRPKPRSWWPWDTSK
jgi:hypothetical protein